MKLYVVAPQLIKFAFAIGCTFILISSQKVNAFAAGTVAHRSFQAAALPQAPMGESQNTQVKSYREWKATILSEAESRIRNTRESIVKNNKPAMNMTEAGLSSNLSHIQDLLDKENLQLSLAKDLTITDYFVGYLIKQKPINQAIKEVSGRLSAEEVAELMTAYANNFFSSSPHLIGVSPRADSGL